MLTYLNGVQTQLQQCIIANARGSKFKHACGLSIYMPVRAIDPTYPQLIWSHKTHWYPFLRQLFSVRHESSLSDFDHLMPAPVNAVVPEQFDMGDKQIDVTTSS